jgi:disulfide bond formation protein DsbB
MDKNSIRIAAQAIIALSTLSLAGALTFEYWGGLIPCEMCYYQRHFHAGATFLAILAIALPRRIGLVSLLLSMASLVLGGLVALYQQGVETRWWEGHTSCTTTGPVSLDVNNLDANISNLVSCGEAQWEFLEISMAGYNAILSLGLVLVILFFSFKKKANHEQ